LILFQIKANFFKFLFKIKVEAMKKSRKKGLLVGVFLGISAFCLEAVEVKFQLAEGQIVSLPLAVAQKSETLAGLIDDLSLTGKTQVELNKEENTIPLTNITSGQWNDIAAILTKISKNENVEEYLNKQTLALTINDYVNLLNSLNYLDIFQGLQVAVKKFAGFIEKNAEAILGNEKDKNLLRQLPSDIKRGISERLKLYKTIKKVLDKKSVLFKGSIGSLSWSSDGKKY